MAAPYPYQPLPPAAEYGRTPPFTRIIRLASAQNRDDPLIAGLELVDVSSTTPYEALSYTWGTDPPNDYLWLSDIPLPIKPNLEAALRSLRLPNMVRRLWVDAVCIDQSNVDEKSRQIQYMRLVYKHSARVIIWLGLKTPGRSLEASLDVLELARGFQATDIRDKIFALMGICDEGLYPTLALTQVEGASNSGRTMRALRSAFTSFNDFMQRHGADPEWGTPRTLRPDYRKDAVTAYIDMTRFLLRKSPRLLNVLHHVQHNTDPTISHDEYPSWVPKWFEPATCFPFRGAFIAGQCDGHFRYFAEIHDNLIRGEPLRPRVLSLDGFRVDVVARVSDVMNFGFADDQLAISTIQNAWSQLFPGLPMFAPNTSTYLHRPTEPLEVAFCNAIAASPLGFMTASMIKRVQWGNWSTMLPANAMEERRGEGAITDECQREISAFLAHLAQTGGGEAPETVPEACTALIGAVRMYSLNRRVFLTRGGRVGIGPSVMRPGDEVVVLLGGKVPFVLRLMTDHHIFMGSCYVRDNDIMWGVETEKVLFRKPGALARVTFELR